MTAEMVAESDVDRIIREQFERDVAPNWRLPVRHATWMRLHRFGVDETQGSPVFIDDGIDVSQQMQQGMGWWVCNVEGWFPYTEWRDVQISEMSGQGRPWLHRLPWLTRMRVFREFVLLVNAWNALVVPSSTVVFWWKDAPELPSWAKRWLSLTNESFERGPAELEREVWDVLDPASVEPEACITELLAQYRKSQVTWRPMMPTRATLHRRYGDRHEYWTFDR